MPPVQPKFRYKIACSASDGYTYFIEKKLMGIGWAQCFPPFLPPPANSGVGAPGVGGGGNPSGGPGLGRRRRRLLQAGTSS